MGNTLFVAIYYNYNWIGLSYYTIQTIELGNLEAKNWTKGAINVHNAK